MGKTGVEWIDNQEWAGLAGSQVFMIIERHAEGWEEISLAMDAWLNARLKAAGIDAIPETEKGDG
jgi:hypothetical protein